MSSFAKIQNVPELEQFHKSNKFVGDEFLRKVNLTVGAYRDENGNPFVLPIVKEARSQIALKNENECQKIDGSNQFGPFGYEPFINSAIELLLGKDSKVISEKKFIGVQCLSGTGALRLGGEFLNKHLAKDKITISDPTWNGHCCIFKAAGFKNIQYYRYYDRENGCLDFEGMVDDLMGMEENNVILLQACAHNPTGLDLNKIQWKKVAKIVKHRRLIPFFDIAYPGFVSGNPEEDAWPIRHFANQGIEMLIMQSFAKNLGLYNERIGMLGIVFNRFDPKMIVKICSQLEQIIHSLWANPPLHGALIVNTILSTPKMRIEWLKTLNGMAKRLREIRHLFREYLERNSVPGKWENITKQSGFFSYTGLNANQVEYLECHFHIYMLADGRINICGLNEHNVELVAKAMAKTIKNCNK